MRITKSRLRSIIREELSRVNERGEVVSLDPETRRGVARLHPTTPEEEEAGIVEIPFEVIKYDNQWRVKPVKDPESGEYSLHPSYGQEARGKRGRASHTTQMQRTMIDAVSQILSDAGVEPDVVAISKARVTKGERIGVSLAGLQQIADDLNVLADVGEIDKLKAKEARDTLRDIVNQIQGLSGQVTGHAGQLRDIPYGFEIKDIEQEG